MSFPKAQGSTFTTDITSVKYHDVALNINGQFVPITGSTAAGVADTVHKYCEGWDTVDIVAFGSVNISGSCGKAQLGDITLGTHKLHATRWSLGADWQLFDVTGSSGGVADTEKNWEWGLRYLRGSIRGYALADGPVMRTRSETIEMDIDQVGTATGTAIIRRENLRKPLVTGGPLPVAVAYEYTSYTFTDDGGGSARYPLLATTDPGPSKGDVVLDLDTGETLTYSCLAYGFQVDNFFQRGGAINVTVRFRVDQAEESSGE